MNEFFLNFHFLRPLFLLCLIPAVVLFIYLLRNSQRATEWRSLVAEHLLPYLLDGEQSKSSKAPFYLLLFIWTSCCIALAGPTWKKLPQPLKKDASALVVLFDLSPSMNTEDLKPSRYLRARLKLIDLLDARKEGLSALIVYSGQAHVVTPLTDDVETIKNLLPSLSPGILPERGSNAEMALREANKLLKDAGVESGNILFITDGIARGAFSELKTLYEEGAHRISVWGFGTEQGAPIPLSEGGFARSNSGEIIVAGLNHSELSDAATRMNGIYIPYTESTEDIQNVLNYGMNDIQKQQREVEREFDQWLEFGPWLVLLCLPLAALGFRRGLLLPLLLFAVFLPSEQSIANTATDTDVLQQVSDKQTKAPPPEQPTLWNTLWYTKDQLAQKKLQDGENKQAAEWFESEPHKAAAHFRAQEFKEAASLLDKDNANASDLYNRGTALTHAGQYDDALKAFDQALELQPDMAKAQHNREIAKKLKELQEQQQNQENSEQNQDQQQNPDQQNQNQNQNQDQSQNQQGQQEGQQEQNQQQGQQQDQQSEQKNAQNNESPDSDQQAQTQEQSDDEQESREDFSQQMAEAEEKAKQQQEQQLAEPGEEQNEQQGEQQQLVMREDAGQTEEQQSLEQWLRKVPDDPGRILRNKFKHEYRQRARNLDSRRWNTPENSEEERW